ncbi:MAG: metallophosphoesterase [Pirellulales bacterium]|nr:metallophosphoesterase [Pirellulales bacterium]
MPIHLPPLTRRRFLAGTLAAGAAALTPRLSWGRTLEVDPHRFALFSDTHISEVRDTVHLGANMAENLARAGSEALAGLRRPAAVLINGDCAFLQGKPGDYEVLVRLLEPIRTAGVPVHLALGNHDQRDHFWNSAQLAAADDAAARPVENKQVSIIESARANLFQLDSLDQTNVTPGRLGEQQLQWLAEALDAHADKPAIIFGHHQPVKGGAGMGLKDTDALFEVLVPRRQVKAYIFGHTHHWQVKKWDDIHLVNLPPTAYPFVKSDPNGWVELALLEQGATLELHTLDPTHKANGERVELPWRAS